MQEKLFFTFHIKVIISYFVVSGKITGGTLRINLARLQDYRINKGINGSKFMLRF